jgi:hypothetical protein
MKFKHVQTTIDDVNVALHRPTNVNIVDDNIDECSLPLWKCSIDIPNSNVKQICQRITNERYLWDTHFAESRTVEKIDDDKEIFSILCLFDRFANFGMIHFLSNDFIVDREYSLVLHVSFDLVSRRRFHRVQRPMSMAC